MTIKYEVDRGVVIDQFPLIPDEKLITDYLRDYWLPKWAQEHDFYDGKVSRIILK
jgi:hypothetical protein